jgi:hypothetical protein
MQPQDQHRGAIQIRFSRSCKRRGWLSLDVPFVVTRPRRIKRQRPEPIREEPAAQFRDFFRGDLRLVDSVIHYVGAQPTGLGSSGPVLLPCRYDGILDEPLLDIVTRQ